MRHRWAGRKLGRTTSHRKALLCNQVTAFFSHERIMTTEAKSKELRSLAERMITLAKRGDLHARRQVREVIVDKMVVRKLFREIAPRMKNRAGGYIRLLKLGQRQGDGAYMTLIELVDAKFRPKEKKKKEKAETKPRREKKKSEKPSAEKANP